MSERTGASSVTGASAATGASSATGASAAPSRREATLVASGAAAGAALALIAAGQAWVRAQVSLVPGTPALSVAAPGRDVAPAVAALALVGLAGAVAILVTARWGRALISLVVAAAGIGIVVAIVTAVRDLADTGARIAARGLGSAGELLGPGTRTVWPWVALAGGVLVALAGLAALRRAGRWPGMSRRYDRLDVRSAHPSTPELANLATWDALDRGQDPTQ